MTSELNGDLSALAVRLRAVTVRVHDEGRRGSGSGVVWDADGLVVTNAHVVRGAAATVVWEDGRRARAEIVRRDDERDLAALRVPRQRDIIAADIRSSAVLLPGEIVVAVGNPLGLTGAVTSGLVQRCNARWVVADVRLAPGNSGGPLADAAGRVVGINSMVAGSLALAVPSDAVAAFLATPATRGRIGISVVPVVVATGSRRAPALVVTAVDGGSRAERAGVLLGDVILGTEAGAAHDLERFAASLALATTLAIVRGGAHLHVTLAPVVREDTRAA